MGLRNFYLIAVLVGMGVGAKAFATCASPPPGYHNNGGVCYPDAPSTDFDQTLSNYPSCGAGRIALSGDGSYTVTSFSSNIWPLTNNNYDYSVGAETNNYNHVSTAAPNPPIYGFPSGWRCYCAGVNTPPATFTTTLTSYPNSFLVSGNYIPRQYPVTFDVINAQPQAGLGYAPVPISTDGLDGRLYSEMNGGGATCGCPNFNEKSYSNGTDPSSNWVGSNCQPMVNTTATPTGAMGSATVLSAYNSQIDPTNILSGSSVPTVFSILLPNSGSDQVGTTTYNRRIWKCADPYAMDSSSPANCIFTASHHACDDGSISGLPSPVSDYISPLPSPVPNSPANKAVQFNNTVNKKLACCLNEFHSDNSDLYEKFDCLDNSRTTYNGFDDLWQSSDSPSDGGQLNAIILTDGAGLGLASSNQKIISGFYSLSGQPCDQFSEFAYSPGSSITRYRVDPLVMSSQQTHIGGSGFVATGTPSPLPTSSAYAAMNAKVRGVWNKTVPTTRNDFLNCPILVRAAVVTTCPSPTLAPNALTTINTTLSPPAPRCAVAGGIQVHVRIEQIFEVTGTAPAPAIDTFMQLNSTASLDVSGLITAKVGDQCPPGTTKKGDLCAY